MNDRQTKLLNVSPSIDVPKTFDLYAVFASARLALRKRSKKGGFIGKFALFLSPLGQTSERAFFRFSRFFLKNFGCSPAMT